VAIPAIHAEHLAEELKELGMSAAELDADDGSHDVAHQCSAHRLVPSHGARPQVRRLAGHGLVMRIRRNVGVLWCTSATSELDVASRIYPRLVARCFALDRGRCDIDGSRTLPIFFAEVRLPRQVSLTSFLYYFALAGRERVRTITSHRGGAWLVLRRLLLVSDGTDVSGGDGQPDLDATPADMRATVCESASDSPFRCATDASTKRTRIRKCE
jgi:hypothetical protein